MLGLCLNGRAYAEASSSVKHEEELREDPLKDVASEAETDSVVDPSSGDEDEEMSAEGKKKKQRIGFRDRKVINEGSCSQSLLTCGSVTITHESVLELGNRARKSDIGADSLTADNSEYIILKLSNLIPQQSVEPAVC